MGGWRLGNLGRGFGDFVVDAQISSEIIRKFELIQFLMSPTVRASGLVADLPKRQALCLVAIFAVKILPCLDRREEGSFSLTCT